MSLSHVDYGRHITGVDVLEVIVIIDEIRYDFHDMSTVYEKGAWKPLSNGKNRSFFLDGYTNSFVVILERYGKNSILENCGVE